MQRGPLSDFSSSDYEALLTALLQAGYVDVSLEQLDSTKRHMFLRHDVDLCPERAMAIARREAALGVRATYYFLVSTDLYSIAAAQTRRILNEIQSLGHDIGLHFDAEQYPCDDDGLDVFAQKECDILELVCGKPVTSISFHRPAARYLNRAGKIAGRRHCYEPVFFTDIGYISDSNGGWHHGHPLDHPAVLKGTAIQLLTHPIWWCGKARASAVETMDRFHDERCGALKAALSGTVTAYRKALENRDEARSGQSHAKELGSPATGS